jgi:EF hand
LPREAGEDRSHAPREHRAQTKKKQRYMKNILSIISALAVSAALATAEEKPAAPPAGDKPAAEAKKPDADKAFGKKDANSDGSLSKEEYTAGAKDAARAEKAFGKLDKDSDGKISKEEFAARPAPKKAK